jgi:hypothetical protein
VETIIARAIKESNSFFEITFFHVKRGLDTIIDWWVNIAMNLELGILMKNGSSIVCYIP